MPYQAVRMNHNWPGGIRITPAFRRIVANFASSTSAYNAERRFGVSQTSILKWMRHFEIPRRPAYSPTKEEFSSWPC